MSGLWALLGILVILGVGIKFLLGMKVSEEELKRFQKANKIKDRIHESVADKKLEHEKDLSAASDFDRARRLWNDKPPKT